MCVINNPAYLFPVELNSFVQGEDAGVSLSESLKESF